MRDDDLKNPRTGKRRNLGTFATRAAADQHERAVQYLDIDVARPRSPVERARRLIWIKGSRAVTVDDAATTMRCAP